MSPRSASAWSSTAPGKGKSERHLAAFVALPFLLDRGVELFEKADPAFAAEAHDVADREPLRRFDQRTPARTVEPPDQSRRDGRLVLAAAEPAAAQVGGKDLGVVDDNGVAPAQQRRQIAHDAVFKLCGGAGPHHQKPGGIARRRRPQRDAVLRQREIEQIRAHSRQISVTRQAALQRA